MTISGHLRGKLANEGRKVPRISAGVAVNPAGLFTQNWPRVLMCWDLSRASSSLSIRLLPWTTAALFTTMVTSPTWPAKSKGG